MPYYSKKRYPKRKRFTTKGKASRFTKRYSTPNKQNKTYVKVGNPFPQAIQTKNNWAENNYTITQTGIVNPKYFGALRLNSAYDTNLDPAFNQESVQFHKIYSRYYDQYSVSYVTIAVKMRNTGTSDCRIVMGISDDQNTVTAMTAGNVTTAEATLQQQTQTRLLEANQGSRYNRSVMYFKYSVNAWNKRMHTNPAAASSVVNNSPAAYPLLWVGIASEGTAPGVAALDFKATFTTRYFDRQDATIMGSQ